MSFVSAGDGHYGGEKDRFRHFRPMAAERMSRRIMTFVCVSQSLHQLDIEMFGEHPMVNHPGQPTRKSVAPCSGEHNGRGDSVPFALDSAKVRSSVELFLRTCLRSLEYNRLRLLLGG